MKGRTHKPMYLLLEINYCCDLRHGVGPITTYLILTLVGVTAFALCSEHFIFFFFQAKSTLPPYSCSYLIPHGKIKHVISGNYADQHLPRAWNTQKIPVRTVRALPVAKLKTST